MLAKNVNDNARYLKARGDLWFFASRLTPTSLVLDHIPPVGASLLAKNVNDNARYLKARGDLRFFASKLAPTSLVLDHMPPCGSLLAIRPPATPHH